jgi:hypothetical protein
MSVVRNFVFNLTLSPDCGAVEIAVVVGLHERARAVIRRGGPVPPYYGHTRADCVWGLYLGPHRASRASFLYSVPAFPSPTSPKWREEGETFELVRMTPFFWL